MNIQTGSYQQFKKTRLYYELLVFYCASLLFSVGPVNAEIMELYSASGEMPPVNANIDEIPIEKLPTCSPLGEKLRTLEIRSVDGSETMNAFLIEKVDGEVDGEKVLLIGIDETAATTRAIIENIHSARHADARQIPVVKPRKRLYCVVCSQLDENEGPGYNAVAAYCPAMVTAYKSLEEYFEIKLGRTIYIKDNGQFSPMVLGRYSTNVLAQLRNDLILILKKYGKSPTFLLDNLQGYIHKKTGRFFINNIQRVITPAEIVENEIADFEGQFTGGLTSHVEIELKFQHPLQDIVKAISLELRHRKN